MNQTIMNWEVPFTESFKEKRFKGATLKGVDVPDYILMWVVQDCKKCSDRDKKIANYILTQRLKELEYFIGE